MNSRVDPIQAAAQPVRNPPSSGIRAGGRPDSRPLPISQSGIIASVMCADAILIAVTGLAATGLQPVAGPWYQTAASIALVVVFAMSAMTLRWLYTIAALARATRQIAEGGLWLFVGLSALVMVHFISGNEASILRPWVAGWFGAGWLSIALARFATSRLVRAWKARGRLVRRTVIAGGGQAAADLIENLDRTASDSVRILGVFDDRGEDRSPEVVGDYRKLGRFEDLAEFCREEQVDLIIIALPAGAEDRILHLLKKLWALPIDVRVSAHSSKLKLRSRAYNHIGNVPFLPVFDKPMSDWASAVKTIEDRVVAALAIVALSPLLLLAALAVRLDSRGPIFFRQIRYGFNNEKIHIFKFRSMYVDQCDARATRLVTRDDPRVTRVGRFLRKTSIDELPQLFNVLRGELSLVGPRPHALQAKADGHVYDDIVDDYFARHKVKPGITGWAQINGWRGETDTVEKIEQRVLHDLYYIENWSLFLDIYILLKTPFSLLDTKNAY